MGVTDGVDDELASLRRAQRGDRLAFGELYDRHVRPVYWQAYALVGDRQSAEDVTQEVFATSWRKIRTITPVDGSVLPWLLTTTRLTAYNVGRRQARRRHDTLDNEPAALGGVEDEVEAALVRAEIERAVAALSPTDQRLYELCVDGAASYEQAALALGVSHASVRNRIHRLRARLRADLAFLRGTT